MANPRGNSQVAAKRGSGKGGWSTAAPTTYPGKSAELGSYDRSGPGEPSTRTLCGKGSGAGLGTVSSRTSPDPGGTHNKKASKAPVSRKKAKEIMRHGEVHNKPLSKKQKGLFGALAGGAKMRKY